MSSLEDGISNLNELRKYQVGLGLFYMMMMMMMMMMIIIIINYY